MSPIRVITAARLAEWREAGIKVDVVFDAGAGLYGVRVHESIRSGDLP